MATQVERRTPVAKALQMLTWMADSPDEDWGIRQVARALDVPPSSAHRTASMLATANVLTSETDGRYRMSLDFFRLATRAAHKVPVRALALPAMHELVATTDETAYLGLYSPERRQMTYVACVHAAHPVQYVLPQHRWLPMYAGAGGLGILPFLAPGEIEEIIATTDLVPLTDRTITDADELRRELVKVREAGYAVSFGRLVVGAVGVSAPIFDARRRVVGVMVLALPEARTERSRAEELGRAIAASARAVSDALAPAGHAAPSRSQRSRRKT